MKSIVIYFSQTGNTEKVARAIRAGITQVTAQCDLQEIRDTNPLRLKEYDLIGFGAPVIGGCPKNVLQFRSAPSAVRGRQARLHSLFARYGAPGLLSQSLSGARGPGSHRHRFGDWYADCYLLHMPQPYVTAGHPDAIDLEEAEAFGREMAVRSMRIRAGETDLIPPAPAPFVPPRPSGDVPPPVVGSFTGCAFDKGSASIRAAHCAWTTAPCMGWTSLLIRLS